jgi:hypothetical protein
LAIGVVSGELIVVIIVSSSSGSSSNQSDFMCLY